MSTEASTSVGATGRQTSVAEAANGAEPVGRAAAVAQAPNSGSPARVPSSELRLAPGAALRSAQVEAAGRGAAAVVQAPGQGNEAEEGASKLVLVLNLRAPAETARQVDTRAAVAHGQTAPAVPIAAPVVAEGAKAVEVPAAGEAEEAGVEAVAGVKAKV